MKWCAQTLPPIFGPFEIFDRNFAKIVALPGNANGHSIVHIKGQSFLKNDESSVKIDP